MRRCTLCGQPIEGNVERTFLVTVRGEGKPRFVAQSKEICESCATPTSTALTATLRRLPSIIDWSKSNP